MSQTDTHSKHTCAPHPSAQLSTIGGLSSLWLQSLKQREVFENGRDIGTWQSHQQMRENKRNYKPQCNRSLLQVCHCPVLGCSLVSTWQSQDPWHFTDTLSQLFSERIFPWQALHPGMLKREDAVFMKSRLLPIFQYLIFLLLPSWTWGWPGLKLVHYHVRNSGIPWDSFATFLSQHSKKKAGEIVR